MPLDPARTVAELRELQEVTGDENGAQRVAWTETWEQARAWLRDRCAFAGEEIDEAGNQWFTLAGESDRALLIGGHIDSGPKGGWVRRRPDGEGRGGGAPPDPPGRTPPAAGPPLHPGRGG